MESLSYKLALDNTEFVRGMRGAQQEARALGASTGAGEAMMASFVGKLAGATAAGLSLTAVIAGGREAFNAFAKQDSLLRGLAAITGSMEAAKSRAQELKAVAKLPGLGFEEAVQGDIRLRAVGFSADESTRSLKAIGNALATVGAGKAELDGVILGLTQMKAKGVISAEEINQIAERVPQIRKAMQDAFGTADTEKLQRMGIGVDQFVSDVLAQLEKLPAAAGGAANAVENLDDAWKNLKAKGGELIAPAAVTGIETATRMMEQLLDLSNGRADHADVDTIMGRNASRGMVEAAKAARDASKKADQQAASDREVARIRELAADAEANTERLALIDLRARKEAEAYREKEALSKRFSEAEEKAYAARLSEQENLQRQLDKTRRAATETAGHDGSKMLGTDALAADLPRLKGGSQEVYTVQAERIAEILRLEKRLGELRDQTAEKSRHEQEAADRKAEQAAKQAEHVAKEAAARQEAAASFQLENRLLDARASGNARLIQQLERQARLEDLKRQLIREQGMSAEDAARAAEDRVKKEEAAKKREERGQDGRHRSRLLNAEESNAARLAMRSLGDRQRDDRLGRGGLDNTTTLAADARRRARESAEAAMAGRVTQSTARPANTTEAILRRSQTTLDSIDRKLGDLGLAGGK